MPRIPEADWVDIREDMTDEEVEAALLAHLRRARTRYTTVVCREARARLTAPMRLEMRAVHDFVLKKLAWIRKTVRKQRLALQAGASSDGGSPSVPFLDSRVLDGGFVYFFGSRLTLRQGAGALYRFNLQTMTLEIPALTGAGELSAKDEFASRTALWLMDAFENVLAGFARRFRARLAAAPQAHRALREVRLSQATTRWGSCTIKGSIRINWRLALLPVFFADYVFAHEAAHLTHFNHSPQFWTCVETYFPDCRRARGLLKIFPISRLFAAPVASSDVLRRLGRGKALYLERTVFVDGNGVPCLSPSPEDLARTWCRNEENLGLPLKAVQKNLSSLFI